MSAAETYISARGLLSSGIQTLGRFVGKGTDQLPEDWKVQILEKLRSALGAIQQYSITGMDNEPGRDASEWLYALLTALSAAIGGAGGLAGILAELPVSTGIMLRSIADIGREHGGRLDDPDFQKTCIEVFAYGGPLDDDDEADLAFLMGHFAGLELTELLGKVALRYGVFLTPKILAMAPPVIGAFANCLISVPFLRFYQSMAHVLFALAPLEKSYDPLQVRSCFASVVREIEDRNKHKGR